MADSGTSSRDEKADIVQNSKPSRRFFSRKPVSTVNTDEKTDVTTDVKPLEEEVPPVSVRQLFR